MFAGQRVRGAFRGVGFRGQGREDRVVGRRDTGVADQRVVPPRRDRAGRRHGGAGAGVGPSRVGLFGEVAADPVPLTHVLRSTGGQAPWAETRDESTGQAATLAVSSMRDHGAVVTVDLPATRSGFAHRASLVYLPPVWFSRP